MVWDTWVGGAKVYQCGYFMILLNNGGGWSILLVANPNIIG